MSIEKVKDYFKKYGMEDKVLEFSVSSATVEDAAIALNCKGQEIAKTMSFVIDGKAIVIVMAGDAKVDNHKYKEKFHTKAVMVKPDELVDMVGHPMGGVCPFALNDGVKVYLDVSVKRFEKVYPACGSGNSAICLTIPELEKYSGYVEWIDIGKGY